MRLILHTSIVEDYYDEKQVEIYSNTFKIDILKTLLT